MADRNDSLATAQQSANHPQEPVNITAQQPLATAVLLLGGLLLLLIGQAIPNLPIGWPQLTQRLLQVLGLLTFLMGGRAALRGSLPSWLTRLMAAPAAYLGVGSGQILLLLFAPAFALLAFLAAGDVALARSLPVSLFAWLLSIACAVGGAVRPGKEPALHIPTVEILITAALFAIALLLRGLASEALPPTFTGDEGSAGLSAVDYLNGRATNLLTVGWFDFPALYFALQGLVIGALGQTVPALRLFAALGGSLTVVATYWLARATLGRQTAWLAALFLAISHYHIHMSRIGLNNIWDGFFAAAAAAGLWFGWQNGRRVGFIVAGLAVGLGQYFYVSIRIMPLLFLIWAAAALIWQRDRFRSRLPGLLLGGFIATIIVLPLGLFYARHPDQFAARVRFVSILGDWMTNEIALTGYTAPRILAIQTRLAVAGFVNEPLRHWYEPGVPLLLGVGAALFVAGLLWALLNINLAYLLLLLPIGATIATVALSQNAPAAQRYVLAAPFVATLVALPLGLLTDWLRKQWPQQRWLTAVPALLVASWLIWSNISFYFTRAYEGFVLGGTNTVVATELARHLAAEPQAQDIYFFGFPRMGFRSHNSVPYLAPHMNGMDVIDPLTSPWKTHLTRPAQFVFLPERLAELPLVQQTYPQGRLQEFHGADGTLLFAVYAVE